MNSHHPVSVPLLIFCFLITSTAISPNSNINQVTGDVSINCGSTGISTAPNGREWIGDKTNPRSTSFLQIKGSSKTSTLSRKLISGDPIPHRTARVSRSGFSYSFHVGPGQKILRLHFTSAIYKGFTDLKDFFTVEAGPFTLLRNFSASLTSDALGVKSFSKEFCVCLQENERFDVSFHPENSQLIDAYAFVNGIEIISVPASVSYFHGGEIGVQVVGQSSPVLVDCHTALELVHRLNIVKEYSVPTGRDLDEPFPMWRLSRAEKVRNKTWKIQVDVGFRYMVRLHVSQIGLKIVGTHDIMYKILINEIVAHTNIDSVKETKDNGNKNLWHYRDYLVTLRGRKEEGKRNLSISVHSLDELMDGLRLLSGFEIFKLTNPDNSLASPNLHPPPSENPPSKTILISLFSAFHIRNAFSFVAVIIISLVSIIAHKLNEDVEANWVQESERNKPSARAERLCRRFSLVEIQFATRDFNSGLQIGRGGFGKVYKGLIDRRRTSVAIKRLKPNSSQGVREFLMEIETLSELRHVNLVSLIGYCNEHREMILVYDYMPGGTLADHLYRLRRMGTSGPALNWKQRLNICIGAGRGLDYLHTGHGIIHRDVKSTNILLDENFVAKVSDFGLAKHEDRNKLQSHVSTRVKGTNGYMDPHYFHTHKLTRKTDTYAFGVVLLEILSGRPAVDLSLEDEEHILTTWARDRINKGEVDQILDSSLREEILPPSLKTFVGIAEKCVREDPKSRPTMSQVVQQLELALEQQQDNGQGFGSNEVMSASDNVHPSADERKDSVSDGQSPVADQTVTAVESAQGVSPEVTRLRRDGRKGTKSKPFRLWPWDAFWNRVKPSKRNDSLSEIGDEANIRATKYDWNMIVAATNQFSSSHKIGQGGFGSVYKALLPTGQLVAVKRPTDSYANIIREFMNEMRYLPNLRHKNIISLLGYCIHREERLLVYEYMENRSVDTFIGDHVQRLLQWEVRFKIIKGITRGVVYLHQDSGLRVIHRDVKAANILLDSEMNPKISDFALARAFAENDSQVETTRVVGTYGYLAPEVAMYGKYSIKSDVYSFGITTLEIVSGKRVNAWRRMDTSFSEPMSLWDRAWELWEQGRVCDLVDERLERAFPEEEALRCVQVALLCIQNEPNLRPNMPTALKMLEGDEPLMYPQKEPFRVESNEQDSAGSASNATCELDDICGR